MRLPKRLYEEARLVVKKRATEATSLNELLVCALRDKLKQLRRARIDAAFVGMKSDADYQRESARLAEQFAANDWETLRLSEGGKP